MQGGGRRFRQRIALRQAHQPRRFAGGDEAAADQTVLDDDDRQGLFEVLDRARPRIGVSACLLGAEVRFDGLAGCLRTPRGGSSRQAIVVVEDGRVRSRLLSSREAARLMGLPDSYRLPATATAALHVAGDGVAVPVVRWLAAELLEPLLAPPAVLAAE